MDKLTENELRTLYFNFTTYRDKYCNGHALMNVSEFYNKYGLSKYE